MFCFVQLVVFGGRKKNQILWVIVEFVVINMMYVFPYLYLSAKFVGHDHAMYIPHAIMGRGVRMLGIILN